MTPPEFKRKWAKYSGKETSAYQEHFNDLCALIGQASPAAADPTGSESFCFQKRVVKDAELFAFVETAHVEEQPLKERGFADVWKRDCFAWEYKGKKKNLDEAYRQLLRYRESLLNPPLLVVCDFDCYVVRTNFNATVQETHEFANAEIDTPRVQHLLRALFTSPDFLKPQRTTDEVTAKLAQQIGEVARSLQERESVELIDAKSRRQHSVAQRKNLRIARFLNRIVFCFFAEDTGLLPKKTVTDIFKAGASDPPHFAEMLEALFTQMATGGRFGTHKIRHFNGHLFEDATVFELTEEEIGKLGVAGEADWQFIQPSIMGNLFERGLDPDQRAQLGAHYTSEEDIKTLVEPVLMAPLRREWSKIKGALAKAFVRGEGSASDHAKLLAFHDQLASITVLDPACGSGNFLYASLQLLLDLEKELITFATQLDFKFESRVSVRQLKAIELNAYAFELAQVSVQIGYLKWRRDNGFANETDPVLQNLDNFQNEDALLVPHFRSKARTLKEAQAGEHVGDDALKFYTEREWPKCEVIVSNPPFLGDKLMRRELGDDYVEELRRVYDNRIPGQSDLCCYWFEKAREQIESAKCKRAGLLATQAIRGGANREVLKRIKNTGDIFFAESDRPWILDGASVHVSMVGFDGGKETERLLDNQRVETIHPQLTSATATNTARELLANSAIGFIGTTKKAPLDIDEPLALEFLRTPNPVPTPSSDVVLPWMNGLHVTRREAPRWIIDFPLRMKFEHVTQFSAPFSFVEKEVRPLRVNHREAVQAKYWWRQARPCPELREKTDSLARYCVTPRVAKHRVIAWVDSVVVPDCQLVAFARADDYFFGVVHSRLHEVWALAQGTQLREKESGFRYTPTTCFETFPFPYPTPAQEGAIATAAKELNELRERWLNPPEWTETRTLEFPGSVSGPWSRYVDPKTVDAKTGIGTVRYPRLEPRDADCAAKLKKRTLTNLYNERPAWLDLAHKKLDAAVAAAYGWSDLIEILERGQRGEIYDFKTGSYGIVDCTAEGLTAILKRLEKEVDEEILKRLLALNQQRAAEEKSAPRKSRKTSRAKSEEEFV